jgi:nucleoside-diphosphate-sugar epimerase
MRLLITGITGFLGSHMAEYALAQGAQVFGSARWRSRTENIEHLRAKIELIDCDRVGPPLACSGEPESLLVFLRSEHARVPSRRRTRTEGA